MDITTKDQFTCIQALANSWEETSGGIKQILASYIGTENVEIREGLSVN